MEKNENLGIINSYLKGDISAEEKLQFEKRLKEDDNLREEYLTTKKIKDIIEAGALKEKLSDIHLKYKLKQNHHKRFYLLTALSVAASFVVVLSFWFLFQPVGSSPQQQFFASIYFKDPGLPTLMSSSSAPNFLDHAMIEYKQGNYEKSYQILSDGFTAYPSNDTVQYYMAINLFEMGEIERSAPLFERLLKSQSEFIKEKAEWYYALNLILTNEKQQAEMVFQKIAEDPSHLYQPEAERGLLLMQSLMD
jgi:tetratricopeptide (TPR) repeat protein